MPTGGQRANHSKGKSNGAGLCTQEVVVALAYGHERRAPCHSKKDTATLECEATVPVLLACGHHQQVRCGRDASPQTARCLEKVPVKLRCGHEAAARCYKVHSEDKSGITAAIAGLCHSKVKIVLACGHEATLNCHEHSRGVKSLHVLLWGWMTLPAAMRYRFSIKRRPAVRKLASFPSPAASPADGRASLIMTTKEFIVEKNATLSSSVVTSVIRRVDYFTLGSASTTVKEDALIVKDAARHAMRPVGAVRSPAPGDARISSAESHAASQCGHTCQGLCDELWPICPRCHPKVRRVLTGRDIGLALEDTSRLYELADCGHTFFVSALDKYGSILKTYFDWCDKAKIALVASGFDGGQPDKVDAGAQSWVVCREGHLFSPNADEACQKCNTF
ncbi:hypothetical protein FOZ63_005794 [Perkinsus olseni]|uniref:Uncharacterized protein n=1 Tax=Perkinsus olseni TaxID=32597 RepID=A0A7J6SXA4_PEROL|nr:hypothetical protein FOZ63_005794 [Perkinsus olseni]KAF4737528.1 hypothetical protein FOZ62_002322 [Perkinsus olseni]